MSRDAHLDLEDFIFIGRTYDEYMRMFALNEAELVGKRILDCPGGACSFAAHSSLLGADLTATDVLYQLSGDVLAGKGSSDLAALRRGMVGAEDDYLWDEFGNVDGQIMARETALTDFIKDYHAHRDRYVAATLPYLPFSDNQFDITLSGHFLFCYAELLGFEMHLTTMKELLRVSRDEVRIFPLVSNGGVVHPHLPELTEALEGLGHRCEVVRVAYEFQRGANELLRITKRTVR